MKVKSSLFLIAFLSVGVLAGTETMTLNEAEKMVQGGKAILVQLPDNAVLTQIKEQDANATKKAMAAIDLNASKTSPAIVAEKETKKIEPMKPKEGISIAMPTTLSSLLPKLSKITGEFYFCEDNLNVPPSNIKITDLEHLNRYLRQVSDFGLVVTRESNDAALPKVIKVVRVNPDLSKLAGKSTIGVSVPQSQTKADQK